MTTTGRSWPTQLFTDKASGKDTQRPQLDALLGFVREGDTVVVHSMDRLARNLDDLRRLVQGLTQRGVRIEFVKEHLTFTGEDSPMANLMLSVMGVFAEFERAFIRDRQETRREHPLELRAYVGMEPCGLGHYRQAVHATTALALQTDKGIVLAGSVLDYLRQRRCARLDLRPRRPAVPRI